MRWRTVIPVVAACLFPGAAVSLSAEAPRVPVAPQLYEGQTLARVDLDIQGSSGDAATDAQARANLAERAADLGLREGDTFQAALVEAALGRLRGDPRVESVEWSLAEADLPGQAVLVVSVRLAPPAAAPAAAPEARRFPVLLRTGRTLVQAQVNGSFGFFNDHGSWFGASEPFVGGNPLFPDPAGDGWATWGEGSLEAGLAAAAQVEDLPLYLYAAATAVTSASTGQDIFRSDTRARTDWEKVYGGFLLDLPGENRALTLSAGRQPWQLNEGFLFSQFAGGFNAADYGATYLAARTALEQTVLLKLRLGKLSLEGFLVDPQEYPPRDSGTEYLGASLQYRDGDGLQWGGVYYEVPESRSRFRLPGGVTQPREGLRTINLRLGTGRLLGVSGLQFLGEVAHQSHPSFGMSADAWYASLGYTWRQAAWTPSLTYRHAFFSGDDPATRDYERFDAPQSSGLDNWLQGTTFKKTVVNANVESHRLRVRVAPTAAMSYTFDYFYLWADEKNNLGGPAPLSTLQTRELGQEMNLTLRWSLSRHLFLLGVAGITLPGSAIDKALGGEADDWSTLQFSLFWNL